MNGLGQSFMKIWTCGSSLRSGSRNAQTRIKNVNGANPMSKFWSFFCAIQMISCRARLAMDETWICHYDPETKQQSMEWRHSGSTPPPQKNPSAKSRWKIFRLDVLGSKRHPPHWSSFKGPNYKRGVLLISAGSIEGHFEGKTPRAVHQGCLVLARKCPFSQGTCNPKETCLPGLPMSWSPTLFPDLVRSDYHLFPGLKKQLKGRHFSSDAEVIPAAETWLDGQHCDFFLSGLQKLEQRAKKCNKLRW